MRRKKNNTSVCNSAAELCSHTITVGWLQNSLMNGFTVYSVVIRLETVWKEQDIKFANTGFHCARISFLFKTESNMCEPGFLFEIQKDYT